jgi:integrase
MGVPPEVIQTILRHSNVKTTEAYYILPVDDEVQKAMATFENNVLDPDWTSVGHQSKPM